MPAERLLRAIAQRTFAPGCLALAGAKRAVAVIGGLAMAGEPLDIVLSGSVFRAADLLVQPMMEAVRRVAPLARAVRLENEPATGAVRLAVQALHEQQG